MVRLKASVRRQTLLKPESGTLLHVVIKEREHVLVPRGLTRKQAHSESKMPPGMALAGISRDSRGRLFFEGTGQNW